MLLNKIVKDMFKKEYESGIISDVNIYGAWIKLNSDGSFIVCVMDKDGNTLEKNWGTSKFVDDTRLTKDYKT